jgi:hypothetical protein
MKKWIHSHFMEVIAVTLIGVFWAGVWAYNILENSTNTAYMSAHSYTYSPGIDQ